MNNQKPEKIKKDTKIADCVCDSQYQDKAYGNKKRVHNPTKDGWRCTICSREHKD